MSLVHAEFLKLTRRRLYPIMAAVLVFLMGFIGVLFYVLLPALPESAGAGAPVPDRPAAFEFGAQQVAGQAWWFAVILVTAILGGELATTVWATGLTRDSRKVNQIAARFTVFTAGSLLAFLLGTVMWSLITFIWADGAGSPTAGAWLSLLWKFAAVAAAWTAIGLGAVALTRSIAVAMGVALGISFLDSIIAPFVDFYEAVSLTAATNGIFDVGDGPFSGFIPGGDFSLTHSLGIMAGWTLVGFAVTWWGLQRRDA